ncbi:hypothetical protein E5S67_01603 [Microcoleus sp. IPMA8]|uniref:Uncharacterized protein n=1 Tax=Microcoleus asticus IPMA8 TaxID=2563858 RepID=A0ABX2CU01_9CYAN|nr:hypothetical protein [Microcoleus asticus IPMA8]
MILFCDAPKPLPVTNRLLKPILKKQKMLPHTQINRVLIAFITNTKIRLNNHKISCSAVIFF